MTSVKKPMRKPKLDIFTQDITPIQNYKIRGDTNPEHEIKNIYLLKMSARCKSKNIFHGSVNPSIMKTENSSNEKFTNFTTTMKMRNLRKIKEEESNQVVSSDSDSGGGVEYNQNRSNSLDKKSSEFLLTLFNQGVCHNDESEKKKNNRINPKTKG